MMKWAVLVWLVAASLVRLPAPVVRVQSGLVRGRISDNGRFYEYFGIPYGIVDERNRFQAPLPPPTWKGTFDALEENTWCPQHHPLLGIIGEPDCLKLNIYTPAHRPSTLLPVMVYIHGGCFFSGTGSPFLYGGDYFAEHGVVFVGINYRLSVEGFLCLGTKEAPGNAGLKDQIAALKWVRDNIRAFGGNPDDVTLFGESAGAVSTSFMILSSAAKGLFHKAILQSGSSLAPWGLQHDPIETASALVKTLGYDTKDPKQIYGILSNRTTEELIIALQENKEYCVADDNIFVPCIEKEIEGVEPVVTQYPADIIMSGNYTKLPMIIGYTNSEGIYFASADYGNSLKNDTRNVDILETIKRDLDFPNENERNWTVESIRRHYFSSYEDEMIMNLVALYSDVYFKFPLILESEMYAKTTDQPIYYYLFCYNGLINLPKFVSGFGLNDGASHADDLFYLFKPHAFPLPQRIFEEGMIRNMVMLWTNFAKYSDPTPPRSNPLPLRWRPSREWNPRALVIDRSVSTGRLWEPNSVAFWNRTYNRYRRRNYGFNTYSILEEITGR